MRERRGKGEEGERRRNRNKNKNKREDIKSQSVPLSVLGNVYTLIYKQCLARTAKGM